MPVQTGGVFEAPPQVPQVMAVLPVDWRHCPAVPREVWPVPPLPTPSVPLKLPALPVTLPVTFPVTLPMRFPVKLPACTLPEKLAVAPVSVPRIVGVVRAGDRENTTLPLPVVPPTARP